MISFCVFDSFKLILHTNCAVLAFQPMITIIMFMCRKTVFTSYLCYPVLPSNVFFFLERKKNDAKFIFK